MYNLQQAGISCKKLGKGRENHFFHMEFQEVWVVLHANYKETLNPPQANVLFSHTVSIYNCCWIDSLTLSTSDSAQGRNSHRTRWLYWKWCKTSPGLQCPNTCRFKSLCRDKEYLQQRGRVLLNILVGKEIYGEKHTCSDKHECFTYMCWTANCRCSSFLLMRMPVPLQTVLKW